MDRRLELLGKLGDSIDKQMSFERHVTRMLYTRLGVSRQERGEGAKQDRPILGFYDAWTGKTATVFPFVVVPVVIASFNFLDIFTKPTRSVVTQTYKDVAEENAEPGRPVAMPFQAYEIGVLVAVPCGIADVPSLSIPPVCMIVHFDRWMDKIVGTPPQEV